MMTDMLIDNDITRQVLDNVSTAVLVFTEGLSLEYMNPSAEMLFAVSARKVREAHGSHYVLGDEVAAEGSLATVAERMRLFVTSIEPSGNLVVVKTPPGSAHSVAYGE